MNLLRTEARDNAEKQGDSKLSPIGISILHAPQAQGFRRALLALSAAYAKAGNALSNRMQHADAEHGDFATLGASYGWISDRRRLVQTYLEAEPAVMAYACADFGEPEQIRSLAETATELAGEDHSLFAAIGVLNYIDEELGWAAIGAPAGNA